MKTRDAVHVLIHGRVQGVGYRFFAQERALALGLCGWVRNNPDDTVTACAEGPRSVLETWIEQLKKGPPLARVERTVVDWSPALNSHTTFSILS